MIFVVEVLPLPMFSAVIACSMSLALLFMLLETAASVFIHAHKTNWSPGFALTGTV